MEYMKIMKNNRTDIGLWAPACVQHGFTHVSSFTDDNYLVKGIKVC